MKKGLTLVELVSVLVVVGIILVIAIPIMLNSIITAKEGAFESDAIKVLHQVEYEKLVDRTFDPETLDITTFTEKLNLSNENIDNIVMNLLDDQVYVTIVGKNKWSGLKACGTSDNMKIVSSSDETTCLSFYGPWSAWQETPVEESDSMDVETDTFYNYQVAEYDWSEWYDLDSTYVSKDNNYVMPVYNVGDKEQQNLYRYRDTSWKWYDNRNVYYPEDTTQGNGTYSSTAPSGYATKDTEQTTYTDWSTWDTTNPTDQTYRSEENRTEYQYRDQQWKWYNAQNRCRQDVWNACWTGYTNSASRCKSTCQSHHGASCGGSYAGQWGPHSNSSGYACYCGYRSYVSGTNYYAGGAWVTGACPGGYYSYEARNAYYPSDTTQTSGTYSSTAPSGYDSKDTGQTIYTAWSSWDITNPTDQTYREESTRTAYRYRDQQWKWYTAKPFYYPSDTTQGNGTYSSTAPSGYATKDTTDSQVSAWTYTNTTTPTNESYREVQIKRQERQWTKSWSVEVLDTYKKQADFATAIQSTLGITVSELQSRSDANITSKTMYRYRTKG